MIKRGEALNLALALYKRQMKRLKNISPEWKPISLKEYINQYYKRTHTRQLHT